MAKKYKPSKGAAFTLKCPKCGEVGDIYVTHGGFTAIGLELHEDGFSFSDAQQMETRDEQCMCCTCQKWFPLSEVTL